MSEPTNEPAPGGEPRKTPPSSDNAAARSRTPKPRRPGRWRRRLIRLAVILLVLAVVLRIAIHLLLPTVLNKVGNAYDLAITFDRQDMMLLGGDVGLWGLKIAPRDQSADAPALFEADYVRGDISVLALLTGRLHALRLEADGLRMNLERTADGRIPALEKLLAGSTKPPPPKPADSSGKPIDFDAPLQIDALRLSKIQATIRDAAVAPPVSATIDMNARVSFVRSDRPTQFEIDIRCDPALDGLHIRGEATASGGSADLRARVAVRGLHAGPLAGYLRPLGWNPVAEGISGEMSAAVRIMPALAPAPAGAIKAELTIADLQFRADGREVAALRQVRVVADPVEARSAHIAELSIEGGRFSALRDRQGDLNTGGFQAVPVPSADRSLSGAPTPPPAAAPPFELTVGHVVVRDVAAAFRDLTVQPPAELGATIQELTVMAKSGAADAPMDIRGRIALPGIARAVAVDGLVTMDGAVSADLAFEVEGIRPDAIRPYLAGTGIEVAMKEGTLRGKMAAAMTPESDGAMTVDARLDGLKLTDGPDLLEMPAIRIQGARLDRGAIGLKAVDFDGPVFIVQRNVDGSVTAGPVRISTPPARTPRPVSHAAATPATTRSTMPATVVAAASPSALPRIDLGRFGWRGVKITLIDQQSSPPSVVQIADAGVEIADLHFDPRAEDAAAKQGAIKAWIKSPRLARSLTLTGSLAPRASGLAADLKLQGDGIDLRMLAPYLKPFGIEPLLADGQARASINATVSTDDAGRISAQLNLSDLSLKEGGDELAGIDKLAVTDVKLDGTGATVASVRINRPRANVLRRADGTLVAAGVHLLPAASPAASSAASVAAPAQAVDPAAAPAQAMTFSLGAFELADARVNWTDEATPRGVRMEIGVNAAVGPLVVGKPGPASPVDLTVAVKDVLDELRVTGTVSASPDSPAAKMAVAARGVRAGPAAVYLPPGIESAMKDGRLNLSIDAGLNPNKDGGQSARLLVSDLNWRDGEASPLVRFDSLAFKAPRVDAAGGLFSIDEISLVGFRADAVRLADGATSAGGIILRPAPAAPAAPKVQAPPPAVPDQPAQPARPAPDLAQLVAEARRPLPLVAVKTLDLGFQRISFSDLSRPGSAPIALVNATFRNLAPIELGGIDAAARPPVRLQFTGRVDPVIGKFDLTTETAPFALEPGADIKLALSGITGDGLLKLSPDLARRIDGGGLSDGRLSVRLQTHAAFARRGPRDFDMRRGFDLDFALTNLELRNGPSGPVLAGVESVQSEKIRVEPATGRVHVKSLEITRPAGLVGRDAAGLNVAGLVLKSEPNTPAASVEPPAVSPSPPQPARQPSAAVPGEGEIRIDRLLVNGIDFRFEDRTVNPAFSVPLTELDVEMRDLSSLAATQERAVRFNVAVGSGKVPLPASGGGSLQEREMFSQIVAAGNLSLYPTPRGRVKAAVNGLDLVAFSSIAAQKGVKLGGGYFDGSVDLRLEGEGSLDARTKLVVTDLSLADAPDGYLKKAFALPAPVDAVIGVLEAPDGSITIPLDIPVKKGELSTGAVMASAGGAFVQIVATALASAPIKIVSGVGGMIGMGDLLKGPREAAQPEAVVISFAAGSASLDDGQRERLSQLIDRAARDGDLQMMIRHELGGADVAVAAVRANPGTEDALALAGGLRARRLELAGRRAGLAAQARAELAGGAAAARSDETLGQLRGVNAEIGGIEQSLDQLYDLLRPGANRQADRRTRAGALEIAQHRLDAVKAILDAARIPNAEDRVRSEAARFNPADNQSPGRITITLTMKKRA